MRWATLIPAALLSANLHAQWPVLPADSAVDLTTRWNHWIHAEGALDLHSGTIDNGLAMGLWQGGMLDRDLRARQSARMDDRNAAGYLLHARLTWTGAPGLLGWEHWRPLISVAHREVLGARFPRDLFELAFFGNAPHVERTMHAGPAAHLRMNYQSVGWGVRSARSASFVRIDVVKGQSFSASDVVRADLFTAADGRRIDLGIQGELVQSDTAGSDLGRFNGMGAALAGLWAGSGAWGDRRVEWHVGVNDLGVVKWTDRSLHLSKDTAITYEGFAVANVLALDDVFINEDRLMDTLGLHQRSGDHLTLLPFHARASGAVHWNSSWTVALAADLVHLPGYAPQFTLSGARTLGERAQVGVSAVQGGFGGVRVGAAVRMRVGQHLLIDLATPSLIGLVSERAHGYGARLGITYGW